LLGRWVRADAATLLTALGVLGFDKSLDAIVATFFDVCSLLIIEKN